LFAFGRSRITVSYWPDVEPLPAAPGSRAVGSGPVATGVNCPDMIGGWTGVCPLFQFASRLQSPLLLFIHTAGTRESFRYSISPCEISKSRLLPPFWKLFNRPVLAYCQNCHG